MIRPYDALSLHHSFLRAALIRGIYPGGGESADSLRGIVAEMGEALSSMDECLTWDALDAPEEHLLFRATQHLRTIMRDGQAWRTVVYAAVGPDDSAILRAIRDAVFLMFQSTIRLIALAYAAIGEFAPDVEQFEDSQDALIELIDWVDGASPEKPLPDLMERVEPIRTCLLAGADELGLEIDVGFFEIVNVPTRRAEDDPADSYDGYLAPLPFSFDSEEDSPPDTGGTDFDDGEEEDEEPQSSCSLTTLAILLLLDAKAVLATYSV